MCASETYITTLHNLQSCVKLSTESSMDCSAHSNLSPLPEMTTAPTITSGPILLLAKRFMTAVFSQAFKGKSMSQVFAVQVQRLLVE